MPDVVGIRFKNCGRIYDFEVNGIEVSAGGSVIVESEFGLSIGKVVEGPHQLENPEKELKKVLRLATENDLKQKKDNELFEKETMDFCNERIMARGIPMKLVCSEVTLDRKRIVFYFTADGRIDFRELVKDLAARFKTRIEMRQIGVRDKAKLVGGLGLCGKEFCCRLFLTSFEPISIRMAKQQELVLNTGKLSGVCGRLMCCLGYEYDDMHAGGRGAVPAEEDALCIAEEKTPEPAVAEPEGRTVRIERSDRTGRKEQTAGKDEPSGGPQAAAGADEQRRRKRRRRRRKGRFQKKSE